uniref:NADH-ubiquinone oxidoreductase chain 3 n=1 Tax=Staphylinoidea sp. 11 KM-2017 TaxID=2219451 RepID=A0A346RHY9_9COLE|nr:NADH dehydrogenase subunit 3 [Staphylinoidea sp. 11 KM-2017]
MFILITMSTLILIISSIMMIAASMISKKSFLDREKISPFECGFDPFTSARLPFSIHFFLIAVIFLIFDVEITLIMPFILIMKISKLMSFIITITFFIMILLLGTYHEWHQGALNWSY